VNKGRPAARTGAGEVRSQQDAEAGRFEEDRDESGGDPDGGGDGEPALAQRALRDEHVEPRGDRVPRVDPQGRSPLWALKYVLSIPTTRVLIVASSLVYFYFSGIRAFAMVFVTGRFGISRALATTCSRPPPRRSSVSSPRRCPAVVPSGCSAPSS
jgi:hypothetical protein